MKLTTTQLIELREAAKPLLKWMNENSHPHIKAIVEPNGLELVEGLTSVHTEEFVKD